MRGKGRLRPNQPRSPGQHRSNLHFHATNPPLHALSPSPRRDPNQSRSPGHGPHQNYAQFYGPNPAKSCGPVSHQASSSQPRRVRHYSAPPQNNSLRDVKPLVLLVGSVVNSKLKPQQISKTEKVLNYSNKYSYNEVKVATFTSVLQSIRAYSEKIRNFYNNGEAGILSKIVIALDCPRYKDEEGLTEEDKRIRFQAEFDELVHVVHKDIFPGSFLIFQSVLFRQSFRKEIHIFNEWLKEAVSSVNWCRYMNCSKNFLTDRGDLNYKLYNEPDSGKKKALELLNSKGIEVLTETYQKFLADIDLPEFPEMPFVSKNTSPDMVEYDDSMPTPLEDISSLTSEVSEIASKLIEASRLLEESRKVNTTLVNCFLSDPDEKIENKGEILESCARCLVEHVIGFFREEIERFYDEAVILPVTKCYEDSIRKAETTEVAAVDVDTEFITTMVKELTEHISSQNNQSMVLSTITHLDLIWRKYADLYNNQKKLVGELRWYETRFLELATEEKSYENERDVLAHLDMMDAIVTEVENLRPSERMFEV